MFSWEFYEIFKNTSFTELQRCTVVLYSHPMVQLYSFSYINFLLRSISLIDPPDISRAFTTDFLTAFIFKIFTGKSRLLFGMLLQCQADNVNVYYVISNCLTKSSRSEVFYKKGNITNFTKFPGNHLRQSLFFNKVAGLRLQLY